MASRDIKDLHPLLQKAWVEMKEQMKEAGYDAFLTCTYRSKSEQDALYSIGRTKPGRRVTNAKGGQSRHNSLPSEAFDIAILERGKLNWNLDSKAWQLAGKIGKSLGLEWGGSWKKKDGPHFQLRSK